MLGYCSGRGGLIFFDFFLKKKEMSSPVHAFDFDRLAILDGSREGN